MAAAVRLTHLTPVLIVDSVEPCLAFWVDRFGFEAKNKVPGPDGKLIFASVERDGIEVMYQTRASVLADSPASASELVGHSTALFITVPDLDSVERAVAGAPVVKPRHKTFYGSTELYVREPGGNTVGFAQFTPEAGA
ncbi:MAG TPA: VOC family protein [Gemmatimonadales bacterium]|nr:VOC family protein [Gemmatimonadales bacterium]